MSTLHQQPRRAERLSQLLLDTRSLGALDVLQMQSRSGEHFDAALQNAARGADARLVLIEALRRTVLAHTHIHAIRPITVLIVEKHQVDVRSSLIDGAKLQRDV